jgi:replication factor C large subunit
MADNQLWTDKHKPKSLSGIVGQNKAVGEVLKWFDSFRPGKALLLYGPPGVGKTLLVELLAGKKQLNLIRLNASDKRAAKNIESFSETTISRDMFLSGKLILIDEIDGISGGDRGGVNALAKLIRKSKYPVFLIANDAYSLKLRPLRNYCKLIKFTKVPVPSITKRLKEICEAEGIEAKGMVLKHLARWSQGDLRSAITDLQNIAKGKKEIAEKDLESLGFRERGSNIFEVLPVVFRSKSISAAQKAMRESDKDPDMLFLWIESNIPLEFSQEEMPAAFEFLTRADLFRALVKKNQNYRFIRYMLDMLAGISICRKDVSHRFLMYRPPQKLLQMSRTKGSRAELETVCRKIGQLTHCSSKIVRRDYLPYLSILVKKGVEIEELEKGDTDVIAGLG